MFSSDLKLVPLFILSLTLLVFLVVGLLSRTRSEGYYPVSGRSIGQMGIGAAIASNWMSAASFLGIAAIFYLKGYFALAYVIGWTGGYVLLLILMAGQIRRFGKHTAPEFVEARYDSPAARLLAACVAILISLVYCVAQYKGIALIFAWIFGLDYSQALILGTTVAVSYLVLSGALGAVRNQQLHYTVLILSFIIPLMVLAYKLDFSWILPQVGYGGALHEISQKVPSFISPWAYSSPFEWIALCFTLMVGTAGLPHVLSHFYTVPNLRDARWSVVWGLFFIGLLYWSAPAYGTFARLWEVRQGAGIDPAISHSLADLVVVSATERAGLSPWLVGILATGGIIAAFSTITGLLITGASAFTYDIYFHLLNPHASERSKMRVAKGTTLLLAAIVLVVAANPPGLIAEITAIAFALAGNTLFPTFLLGIWWDRTNKYGAIAGMAAGVVITFAPILLGEAFPMIKVFFPVTSSACLGAPLVILVMVAVSLMTPPPSDRIRSFLSQEVHKV